ncbi:KdsC [Desulforapulum autotrophicum HRM2]|uniref:KdsC n=1 Tax=Desulforapulum autotrophicum (strain ATCC 43914 / DSM 3382 / VKM B-1955 / HRM2) TaxID=177437 RepID=C0QJ60_DESAH|nr:HAD-IIIA family hydrolase [Desulforapulum autotrophicum]ACN15873.1 KdsC [Desulforapulum autotrophicum HRM2]
MNVETHPSLEAQLKQIKLLLLDVDGVLTDGAITYTDQGDEIKRFSVKDGLGLRLLMDAGIRVGIITGRKSQALTARCNNLGINLLYDGIKNKVTALETILDTTGFNASETAFAGDDLPDICVMARVGLAIAVADATDEVKQAAHLVTRKNGGGGAVREVCELILKTRGEWNDIINRFSR